MSSNYDPQLALAYNLCSYDRIHRMNSKFDLPASPCLPSSHEQCLAVHVYEQTKKRCRDYWVLLTSNLVTGVLPHGSPDLR